MDVIKHRTIISVSVGKGRDFVYTNSVDVCADGKEPSI